MSQPVTRKSVDGVSGEETGSDTRTLGHYHLTLFATADGLDTADDTVEVVLEASPNRKNWSTVTSTGTGNWEEDPDNSGVYTATTFATGEYYEFIRARVKQFDDAADGDLSVDGWVMAGGNSGQGRKGTDRNGPVTNL